MLVEVKQEPQDDFPYVDDGSAMVGGSAMACDGDVWGNQKSGDPVKEEEDWESLADVAMKVRAMVASCCWSSDEEEHENTENSCAVVSYFPDPVDKALPFSSGVCTSTANPFPSIQSFGETKTAVTLLPWKTAEVDGSSDTFFNNKPLQQTTSRCKNCGEHTWEFGSICAVHDHGSTGKELVCARDVSSECMATPNVEHICKDEELISNAGATKRKQGAHRPSRFEERALPLQVSLGSDLPLTFSQIKRKRSLRVPKAVGWQRSSAMTEDIQYGGHKRTRDPHYCIGCDSSSKIKRRLASTSRSPIRFYPSRLLLTSPQLGPWRKMQKIRKVQRLRIRQSNSKSNFILALPAFFPETLRSHAGKGSSKIPLRSRTSILSRAIHLVLSEPEKDGLTVADVLRKLLGMGFSSIFKSNRHPRSRQVWRVMKRDPDLLEIGNRRFTLRTNGRVTEIKKPNEIAVVKHAEGRSNIGELDIYRDNCLGQVTSLDHRSISKTRTLSKRHH